MSKETVFPNFKEQEYEERISSSMIMSKMLFVPEGGLTKREYFAAMAMQGLLSGVYSDEKMLIEFTKVKYCQRPRGIGEGEYVSGCEAITSNAVSYADALLARLAAAAE